jgi:16S rRNA (guanine527-N7)-methyltransferase
MEKLNVYKELVKKYHHTLDLVSDIALEHFDEKIADSLIYADLIREKAKEKATILDVGSGAGLPGLVVAIALPHHPVLLIERRQKRAAFLKIAVSQLGLTNTKVYLADVTELKDIRADVIIAMAVGSFKLLYCLTRHLHSEQIILMSRKGKGFSNEIHELGRSLDVIPDLLTNPTNVSRETIYGNLVAVELVGGLECSKNSSGI